MRLWILRSNAANPDVRVEKYFRFARQLGMSVQFFGWARNGVVDNDYWISRSDENLRAHLYCRAAPFGHGLRNLPNLIRYASWLFWVLFSTNRPPEFVHACDLDTAAPAFFANIGRRLFRRRVYKIIYDVFDYYPDAFPLPKITRRLVEKVDRFILSSVYAVILPDLSRTEQVGLPRSDPRVVVIPNANDIHFDYSHRVSSRLIRIGYSGVLVDGRFLREVASLVKEDNRFELYVVGFGPLEGFFLESSRECARIKFFGRLPHTSAMAVIASTDVIHALYDPLIPNHIHASPNKFYESLQLGVPILVLKGTAVDSLVQRFDSGCVWDGGGATLADCIIESAKMNSTDFRSRCSASYRSYFSEFHQVQHYASLLSVRDQ